MDDGRRVESLPRACPSRVCVDACHWCLSMCVCVTRVLWSHTHISLTAFCITRGITSAMALAHANMCLSCFRHHIVKVYDLALSTQQL